MQKYKHFFIPQGVPGKKFQKTLEKFSYLFRQHFRETVDNGIIFAQYLEKTNDISAAWREYQSLPSSEWRKDFFCFETGGYLVTSWKRIELANKNQKELLKFEKEHEMCEAFSHSGLRIKYLEDEKPDGSYDVICNDMKGDLKKTKGAGNIVRYAKYATRKQGADIVLFEFEKWKSETRNAVSEMIRKNLHGYYFITGTGFVHAF